MCEGKAKIAKYFLSEQDTAIYEYDFGDGWIHEVMLEKKLQTGINEIYPQCIDGARACPPEDCGGANGYESLLTSLANSSHAEYRQNIDWLGTEFDPELFDPFLIKFTNPEERR